MGSFSLPGLNQNTTIQPSRLLQCFDSTHTLMEKWGAEAFSLGCTFLGGS